MKSYPPLLLRLLLWSILLLYLHTINTTIGYSQEQVYHFKHLGVEEGLPQLHIEDLLIDQYGFLWIATLGGVFKYNGYSFVEYAHQPGDPNTLSYPIVQDLLEDHEGTIWVATEKGLDRYDREKDSFTRFLLPTDSTALENNRAYCLFEDKNDRLWVGTEEGLNLVLPDKDTAILMPKPQDLPKLPFRVQTIREDHTGNLLIGTRKGLFLKKEGQEISRELLSSFPDIRSKLWDIKCLWVDANDQIWIGSVGGIRVLDRKKNLLFDPPLPDSLMDLKIRTFFADNSGNLWIGMEHFGLIKLHLKNKNVNHIKSSPYKLEGISSDRVLAIDDDKAGNLFFGTTGGVNILKSGKFKFPQFQTHAGLKSPENIVVRVHQDNSGGIWYTALNGALFHSKTLGGQLERIYPKEKHQKPKNLLYYYTDSEEQVWAVNQRKGLSFYNLRTKNWTSPDLGDTLNKIDITILQEDSCRPDFLWIGTVAGLCKLDKRTLTREWFFPNIDIPEIGNQVHTFTFTEVGDLLVNVGGFKQGTLALFYPDKNKFHPLLFEEGSEDEVMNIPIRNIYLTHDNIAWMSTPHGLFKYDLNCSEHQLYGKAEGLQCMGIASVVGDAYGNLWIACENYIVKYIVGKDAFIHFDIQKEMKDFYSWSWSKGPDGRIFFGGLEGFYAFYPDSVQIDSTSPNPVLTGFKILNHPKEFETAPELIREISLSYRDNVFSFEFAGLHFTNPGKNRYRYQLEGFDQEWVESGSERKATYTNLPYRKYVFKVLVANADGVWNSEPLIIQLRIHPPPWLTWWAYAIYGLLVGGALYFLYRFQLNRKLEKAEVIRMRELDQFKSRFFTSITHEFRTPLTIIDGEARQILKNLPQLKRDDLSAKIQSIQRNGKQILLLVDQVLDLAKIEQGKLSMKLDKGNLINYLQYLTESFHPLAAGKQIVLRFSSDIDHLRAEFDKNKIRKILNNLLSNAIKFTPERGQVSVGVSLESNGKSIDQIETSCLLTIAVKDTGIGIPKKELTYIFDRFYQVDRSPTRLGEGTGIGLALTRELVNLLGGTIEVKSNLGRGSTFKLQLPVKIYDLPLVKRETKEKKVVQNELPSDSSSIPILPLYSSKVTDGTLVLLIEDNIDVQNYLASILRQHYRLAFASNGKEGLEKAHQMLPDLIISDIMMPEMDGFTVCHYLKTNPYTSHIPVILLTAKVDANAKMEGIQKGADLYLPKPFEEEQLLLWIENRLNLHRILQKKYSSTEWLAKTMIAPNDCRTEEEQLLGEFINLIKKKLNDPKLKVPVIARNLGYSESSLNKKLKSITGQSVKDYVFTIRMSMAAQLLTTTDLRVSEIANKVGYKDPNTFSRYFRKKLGNSPTKFRTRECSN